MNILFLTSVKNERVMKLYDFLKKKNKVDLVYFQATNVPFSNHNKELKKEIAKKINTDVCVVIAPNGMSVALSTLKIDMPFLAIIQEEDLRKERNPIKKYFNTLFLEHNHLIVESSSMKRRLFELYPSLEYSKTSSIDILSNNNLIYKKMLEVAEKLATDIR